MYWDFFHMSIIVLLMCTAVSVYFFLFSTQNIIYLLIEISIFISILVYTQVGPMSSNHSNLYKELLALVWGCYWVLHFKVNGTGARVGEENRTARGVGQRGQDRKEQRRELPVLRYHKIFLIYLYPFLVVIILLISCIIFINDCICILTGLTG